MSALDRELRQAHERAREQTRTVLRPLLIDIIDVRDRLAAGLAAAPRGERRRGGRDGAAPPPP